MSMSDIDIRLCWTYELGSAYSFSEKNVFVYLFMYLFFFECLVKFTSDTIWTWVFLCGAFNPTNLTS